MRPISFKPQHPNRAFGAPPILGVLAVVVCLSFLADAAEVSLENVPALVRQGNASLKAASATVDAARARSMGAGFRSNPEFDIEMARIPGSKERSLEIGFSQTFPLTKRLELEKNASRTGIEIAEREVEEVGRQLIEKAKVVVVKLIAIREQSALRQKQVDLAKDLTSFIEDAASRGELSPLDAGQAKLEATQLAFEMRQISSEKALLIGELKTLLGLDPKTEVTISGSLSGLNVPSESQIRAGNRPDYEAAILAGREAKEEAAVEKSKEKEDIQAGVFAARDHSEDAPNGLEKDSIIGLRFSLPLPLRNPNAGRVEEKLARQRQAEQEADALALQIRNEAAAKRNEMLAHKKLIEEIDSELLPLAAKQVDGLEKAYRQGQGNLQQVLRARDQQIMLQSTRLDGVRDFYLAKVTFDSIVGADRESSK